MKAALGLMLALVTGIAACDGKPDHRGEPTPTLGPLESAAGSGEVIPLAGGGAYATSAQSVLYVNGPSATAVAGLPKQMTPEIVPLADGSAILKDALGMRLYLLRGSTAVEVQEGPAPTPAAASLASPSGFYFAEAQRQRRRAKQAEEEREEALNPSDDDTGDRY